MAAASDLLPLVLLARSTFGSAARRRGSEASHPKPFDLKHDVLNNDTGLPGCREGGGHGEGVLLRKSCGDANTSSY